MRDLFTVLVFSLGAILALKRPYYGALVWVWIGLMNPHRLGWGFAYDLPLAQIAVVVTLIGMILHPKEIRWPGGGPTHVLLVLTLWMGVTTAAAILVEPSAESYLRLLKIVFMTCIVAMLVHTRDEIIGLVWTIVMSIGFYGVKGGIFTLRTGGSLQVWGPPESLINGNNEIAIALVMIVPLLYFLASDMSIAIPVAKVSNVARRWIRRGIVISMVLCVVAALGSQSRGALLAIASMIVVLWWRSEKRLQLSLALLFLIPLALFFLPETWYARMETIGSYDEDSSALGRINAWQMAYNIARDRITGAGFATAAPVIYSQYAPNPDYVVVAHSIYFQMLGEHGFIGLGMYLIMWSMTYTMAGGVISKARMVPELGWVVSLASMLKVSLVGFAVGGAFLSLAYWDMSYYLIVITVALRNVVARATARDWTSRVPRPAISTQ